MQFCKGFCAKNPIFFFVYDFRRCLFVIFADLFTTCLQKIYEIFILPAQPFSAYTISQEKSLVRICFTGMNDAVGLCSSVTWCRVFSFLAPISPDKIHAVRLLPGGFLYPSFRPNFQFQDDIFSGFMSCLPERIPATIGTWKRMGAQRARSAAALFVFSVRQKSAGFYCEQECCSYD